MMWHDVMYVILWRREVRKGGGGELGVEVRMDSSR